MTIMINLNILYANAIRKYKWPTYSVFVVVTPLEVGVEAGVAWVDNVGPVDGRAVAPDETDEVDWDPGVVNPGFVGAVVV